MKSIKEVDKQVLEWLFDWKQNDGQFIRFTVDFIKNQWILQFFSTDMLSQQKKHTFASFTGKNEAELKAWALDCLASFKLKQS
jgi:hypothetical protein